MIQDLIYDLIITIYESGPSWFDTGGRHDRKVFGLTITIWSIKRDIRQKAVGTIKVFVDYQPERIYRRDCGVCPGVPAIG